MNPLNLEPITLREAKAFVAQHHRHSKPPRGWKVGVGVVAGDELVGVGILGRTTARNFPKTTAEITRVCTRGERNACSMLYGALCRAAFALGYNHVITYTMDYEPGVSLLASGFTKEAVTRAEEWSRPSRPRELDIAPQGPKVRWGRHIS